MRNVLVTGGSRGIGLAVARELAGEGFRVIAVARKPTEALEAAIAASAAAPSSADTGAPHPPSAGLAKEPRGPEPHTGSAQDEALDPLMLRSSAEPSVSKPEGTGHGPPRIVFEPFDLADIDAIPAFVRRLRADHGSLYGLVNNAGLGTEGLLATMHNAAIEALIRLNTLSPIVLTKYVVRGMMAEGQGRVVNMASIIGSTGFNGLSVYGATKASLIGFTRSLAREVGRVGVTVNAVAPGFVATEMTGHLAGEARGRITRRAALRRLAEAEDVARMVAFLIGEGGRNITGTVMTVDAGNTA